MPPDPVIALLQQRLGLAPETVGPKALRAAVHDRMTLLGLDALEVYALRLESDPQEFLALVEEVVVPESWFFRGAELFGFIASHVLARRRGASVPFRLLSAPCGAGQEPYSLAIALTEAGLPAPAWSIDAVDISPRNLRQARHAIYGALAFREMSPALHARYFREGPEGTALCESIRSAPRFRQGNLLDPLLLQGEPPFDLILCRNVLIYLHDAARRQVLATLKRLLAPGGLVATGTAESLPALDPEFVPAGSAFVYRRATEPAPTVTLSWPSFTNPAPTPNPSLRPPPLAGEGEKKGSSAPTAALVPPPLAGEGAGGRDSDMPISLLARARRHADDGRLAAALEDCSTHLERAGPSADTLSLLGILRQSAGDWAEAARCFQKALYLDPEHEEALVHLLLLYESGGDAGQADRLRQRLKRLRREAES
ncbi:MAG: tetratricopeptide repeat protein [Gemmataceae bacterium]|nr:tetratricopeptide repeat protein [Gemmataceae bacterium]